MHRLLAVAVVALAALALIVSPTISGGQQEQPITAAPAPCTPLKQIYSWSHWRDRTPLNGQTPCAGQRKKMKHRYFLYRHYRQIAPYRCLRGPEGYFAVPCYIVACESHYSWGAYNPSGAVGAYQLLGWGAPYPARTFRQRVKNHEIAASLSLSNWVCA